MRKATHNGHCQICDRLQALPGGVLAKHGYTTRWGFFSGTCPGSGYKPFELSTDRIQAAIDSANLTAKSLLLQARELRNAEPNGNQMWMNVYFAYWNHIPSGYEWRLCPARETTHSYKGKLLDGSECDRSWTVIEVEQPVTRDGKTTKWVEYRDAGFYAKTLAETIAHQNIKRAYSWEQHADKYVEYARWQQSRIDGWKPAPLTPRGSRWFRT